MLSEMELMWFKVGMSMEAIGWVKDGNTVNLGFFKVSMFLKGIFVKILKGTGVLLKIFNLNVANKSWNLKNLTELNLYREAFWNIKKN